jgi:DNA-directed RNA polymerase sigma subunit (sigma70/sigma32)
MKYYAPKISEYDIKNWLKIYREERKEAPNIERDIIIICLRFGLIDSNPLIEKLLADKFNLSTARIYQIIKKFLRKSIIIERRARLKKIY